MTEPYYRDDHVTLYHGDCRDLLPLPATLCVTDPPYAVKWSRLGPDGTRALEMLGYVAPNWSGKGTHTRGYSEHRPDAYADLLDPAWTGVRDSLPPGGLLASFTGNRTLHELVGSATRAGFQTLDLLVFPRSNGVAKSTSTLKPEHEVAALLRLPGPVTPINPTRKLGNVLNVPRSRRAEAAHLTTKPLDWMLALTGLLTQPGDTVLDPFAGSGTTLLAARNLGCRAIGIEVDERACEVAATRLAGGGTHPTTPDLFTDPPPTPPPPGGVGRPDHEAQEAG